MAAVTPRPFRRSRLLPVRGDAPPPVEMTAMAPNSSVRLLVVAAAAAVVVVA